MTSDDAGSGRWLTYDEIAALRGIKRIGAVRLVQRYKWRRMEGNDGKARILVPAAMLEPVRRTDAGSDVPANADSTDAGSSAISALQAAFQTALEAKDGQIEALRGQVTALQVEAAAERSRADRHELEQDRLEGELEAARIGQAEAEADAAELRQQIEQGRAGSRLARAWRAWRGE